MCHPITQSLLIKDFVPQLLGVPEPKRTAFAQKIMPLPGEPIPMTDPCEL